MIRQQHNKMWKHFKGNEYFRKVLYIYKNQISVMFGPLHIVGTTVEDSMEFAVGIYFISMKDFNILEKYLNDQCLYLYS